MTGTACRAPTNSPLPLKMLIGLISDTHGMVRVEAIDALRGCDMIVHAGDVGSPHVLKSLGNLAPVYAVRGNTDREGWTDELPWSQVIEAGDCSIYVLHILDDLDLDPAAAGFQAVIYGHSHQPQIANKNGVLYINPGSAGPRRFRLPVSVARLWAEADGLSAEIIELPVE